MTSPQLHPSSAELIDFVQGRLSAAEQADIEQHVAQCDECCRMLADAPEDSLLNRLRNAETCDVVGDVFDTEPPIRNSVEVPSELIDHPRYRIRRVLGVGGMGVVFEAEHRLMERAVALKVISRNLLTRPEIVDRFEQEVKAAAKLAHPNIVVAHDAEQVGDLHFLVMEFVDGQSLAKIVARKGPLPVVNACHYIRQAAQGLQHAHEKGMVHRDIKPQNLMLTKRGQIKVLDFGLARLRQIEEVSSPRPDAATEELDTSTLTRAGSVLGTPDYMAPEQAEDPRHADARSDLYSLGCTLYFLLTGQPPFAHESAIRKLQAHQQGEMRPVTEFRDDVPNELQAVLARLVAKAPEERFQTAAEVVQAIAPLARGTIDAVPSKTAGDNPSADRRRRASDARPAQPVTQPDSLLAEKPRPPLRRLPQRGSTASINWADWFSQHHRRIIVVACCSLLALIIGNEVRHWINNLLGPTMPVVQTPTSSEPSARELDRAQQPARLGSESSTMPKLAEPQRRFVGAARRIGVAVWSEGFIWAEYRELRDALENSGAQIVVISDAAHADSAWGTNERIAVDQQLDRVDIRQLDGVILTGGKQGVFRFFEAPEMRQLIQGALDSNKPVAGIGGGAAPLLKGGFAEQRTISIAREMHRFAEQFGAKASDDPATRDGLIVTGRDAGAAADVVRLMLQTP